MTRMLLLKINILVSVYSLISNSGYSNITHLFADDQENLPDEDTLTVAKGIVGNYPNAF